MSRLMPQRAPRAQPPPPPIVEAEKPKNDGDLIIEGSGLEIEIKKCLKFQFFDLAKSCKVTV